MKIRFPILLALLALGCSDTPGDLPFEIDPQFAAGGLSHSVSGSGHLPSGSDDKRIFSFTAQQGADGSVSGQFTLLITAPVLGSENPSIVRIEAEVVCVSVAGDRAWVGGVVKNSTRSDWVGRQTGWAVQDNGPGNEGDLISLMNIPSTNPDLAQSVCDNQTRVPNRLIEAGSVRISSTAGPGDVFFPFSFPGVVTCAELVDVEGFFHPVFQFTADGAGGFHSKGHFNATGIGLGRSTGAIYNWNDAINFESNFRPPQETFTSQQSLLLVGRGDAVDQRLKALFHVTVTPQGVVNITADNFTQECG